MHGAPIPVWLSVAGRGNSKARHNLLKTFTEIHNSLRSDNGFLLITQILTDPRISDLPPHEVRLKWEYRAENGGLECENTTAEKRQIGDP